MPNALPEYLLGADLTVSTITPISLSGVTIVPGSPTDLADVVMVLRVAMEGTNADLRPLRITGINEVRISKGFTCRLRAMQLHAATLLTGVILANLVNGGRFLIAGTVGGKAISGYFVLRPGGEFGIENREGNEESWEFGPMTLSDNTQINYAGTWY